MLFLTPQQVLFIHSQLVRTTGGSHGVRDVGALQAATARPSATFDGKELYPDLFAKAAALMESLIMEHPFIDGNKRTAIAASAVFLRRNGYVVTASQEALLHFATSMADGAASFKDAQEWFQTHTRPT